MKSLHKSFHLAQLGPSWALHGANYLVDSIQRSLLFWDILRKRGNIYLEHLSNGQPPVLNFDYEIVIDGRDLPRPVNYALAKILPQDGDKIDDTKRPVVVIDPRAGHGPGIGGSKKDSEIGVALDKGHPVYFVLFFPDPVPGQTLADVEQAEVKFIEEVAKLHPDASQDPAVIGNCQAGWAVALIGADRPDVTGPLVLNGSPLSFWAGENGKNRMRYRGGLIGGAWVASLLSDLGNGTFDGAHLVSNFESLNPANTYWKKQYNLFAKVDTEEHRYLSFEKWWNGYFCMTAEEIESIVGDLFVGNRLERGEVTLDDKISLKNLEDPMLVFASSGDNITPPVQALNWITQVYEDVEDIKRNQQVIIYMLHDDIGHLGIFVSGKVARKEHSEIIGRLDIMERLPPGLYEMKIEEAGRTEGITDYKVYYHPREVSDIEALNDGMEDEEDFPSVDMISKVNEDFYKTFVSPWVRSMTTPWSAELIRQTHPLRLSRYFFSDINWAMGPIAFWAPVVKENRLPVQPDNPFRAMETITSNMIVNWLNFYRDFQDNSQEATFKAIYGNPRLKEMAKRSAMRAGASLEQASEEPRALTAEEDRQKWQEVADQGGFEEAVIRILIAMIGADNVYDGHEFEALKKQIEGHPKLGAIFESELVTLIKEQSRIFQSDRELAITTLGTLLPESEDKEEAIALAREIAEADGQFADEESGLLLEIQTALGV